ncbi:hypothetical protein DFH27DRAFT_528005 [Peziza echinospora]|nr:hypothetical protein DFH27DRAFT_528005 [Peziza echinospora]
MWKNWCTRNPTNAAKYWMNNHPTVLRVWHPTHAPELQHALWDHVKREILPGTATLHPSTTPTPIPNPTATIVPPQPPANRNSYMQWSPTPSVQQSTNPKMSTIGPQPINTGTHQLGSGFNYNWDHDLGRLPEGSVMTDIDQTQISDDLTDDEVVTAYHHTYSTTSTSLDEPRTFRQASHSPDAQHWEIAMQEEMDALARNNTWEVVPIPEK